MKKIIELKNVIEFYTLANKLKTTIVDDANNYSIADQLYGTIILAIAINNEFNQTNEVEKIIRAMILDEIIKLNPDYQLQEKFKNGRIYYQEILSTRSLATTEGKLISKYKKLDILLTNLIQEEGNKLDYETLSNKGIAIIKSIVQIEDSYSKYQSIFDFYYHNFKLKNKVRGGWDENHWNVKAERLETVAEHIVSAISLAMAMNAMFQYSNLNIDKVTGMLSIHEIGESIIGDITPHDGINPEDKKKYEQVAVLKVIGNLSNKNDLFQLFQEFDEHQTLESIFSYFSDKLDADLQSKLYQDMGMHISIAELKEKELKPYSNPKVQKIIQKGAETIFEIWYHMDKSIYESKTEFKEFRDLLKMIKDNNMLNITNGILKERRQLNNMEHQYLVDEISCKIKELKELKDVDCIYMTIYPNYSSNKATIYLNVLLVRFANKTQIERILYEINTYFRENNHTTINVEFVFNDIDDYSRIALNPSDVRRAEELTASSIIFDKSNKITSLRDELLKTKNIFTFQTVALEPLIEEPIRLAARK